MHFTIWIAFFKNLSGIHSMCTWIISIWFAGLCLIQHESNYNTAAINHNTNGSTDYGIFQVRQKYFHENSFVNSLQYQVGSQFSSSVCYTYPILINAIKQHAMRCVYYDSIYSHLSHGVLLWGNFLLTLQMFCIQRK